MIVKSGREYIMDDRLLSLSEAIHQATQKTILDKRYNYRLPTETEFREDMVELDLSKNYSKKRNSFLEEDYEETTSINYWINQFQNSTEININNKYAYISENSKISVCFIKEENTELPYPIDRSLKIIFSTIERLTEHSDILFIKDIKTEKNYFKINRFRFVKDQIEAININSGDNYLTYEIYLKSNKKIEISKSFEEEIEKIYAKKEIEDLINKYIEDLDNIFILDKKEIY